MRMLRHFVCVIAAWLTSLGTRDAYPVPPPPEGPTQRSWKKKVASGLAGGAALGSGYAWYLHRTNAADDESDEHGRSVALDEIVAHLSGGAKGSDDFEKGETVATAEATTAEAPPSVRRLKGNVGPMRGWRKIAGELGYPLSLPVRQVYNSPQRRRLWPWTYQGDPPVEVPPSEIAWSDPRTTSNLIKVSQAVAEELREKGFIIEGCDWRKSFVDTNKNRLVLRFRAAVSASPGVSLARSSPSSPKTKGVEGRERHMGQMLSRHLDISPGKIFRFDFQKWAEVEGSQMLQIAGAPRVRLYRRRSPLQASERVWWPASLTRALTGRNPSTLEAELLVPYKAVPGIIQVAPQLGASYNPTTQRFEGLLELTGRHFTSSAKEVIASARWLSSGFLRKGSVSKLGDELEIRGNAFSWRAARRGWRASLALDKDASFSTYLATPPVDMRGTLQIAADTAKSLSLHATARLEGRSTAAAMQSQHFPLESPDAPLPTSWVAAEAEWGPTRSTAFSPPDTHFLVGQRLPALRGGLPSSSPTSHHYFWKGKLRKVVVCPLTRFKRGGGLSLVGTVEGRGVAPRDAASDSSLPTEDRRELKVRGAKHLLGPSAMPPSHRTVLTGATSAEIHLQPPGLPPSASLFAFADASRTGGKGATGAGLGVRFGGLSFTAAAPGEDMVRSLKDPRRAPLPSLSFSIQKTDRRTEEQFLSGSDNYPASQF